MTEKITRTIAATPEQIWDLWTTAAGIEQWWAPAGFATTVQQLELEPNGALEYTMTAVEPEQVAFMTEHGMPLATASRKTFTEVDAPTRLAYTSLIDFVPDHAPYEQHTVVVLHPVDGGTLIEMTMEPLHDQVWTERLVAGRANELENLESLLGAP